MIQIFEKLLFMQMLMGLDRQHGFAKDLIRFGYSVIFISAVLLPTFFFLANFRCDLNLALTSFPPIFGLGSLASIYFHMLINRERIHAILNEIQEIVNEGMFHCSPQ